MKKTTVITFILAILLSVGATYAEINGELSVSSFKDIDRSSIGVSGMIFPPNLAKGRLSFGFDFGLELIERHLNHVTGAVFDSVLFDSGSGWVDYDYTRYLTKEYRDYMFLPVGVTVRYDMGDFTNQNAIHPSFFLTVGGVLNIVQKNHRLIKYYYDYESQMMNDPNNNLWYWRDARDYGGTTISNLDFYVKPKVAVFWHRFYLSYEYHLNTKYIQGSTSFGYVFKL